MQESPDVLIVGAGQQGMAVAKLLLDEDYSVVVLEKEKRVGDQWRKHYDSLTLFTPRKYSSLPSLQLSGSEHGYARKDEFADYLERYAQKFKIPIVVNAPVTNLTKEKEFFIAETQQGTFKARAVVVTNGSSKPFVPECAHKVPLSIFSLHSSEYKNPKQIPEGAVLVVGNGNSATQIACELSNTHSVSAAIRFMPKVLPPLILGTSFYFWYHFFGIDAIPSDSLIGRMIVRDKDFVVGGEFKDYVRKGIIKVRSGVVGIEREKVVFDDGSYDSFRSIIWATGYVRDYSWLQIPGTFKQDGSLKHYRGVSPVQGLFFAGIRNQITTASGNIYGAGDTARFIVRTLTKEKLIS